MVDFQVGKLTFHAAPQPAGPDIDFSAATSVNPQTLSHQVPRQPRLPRLLPAIPSDQLEAIVYPQNTHLLRPRQKDLRSPFTDREDRLIESSVPRYIRPENGQVNGYVKFNWPSRPGRATVRPAVPDPPPTTDVEEVISDSVRQASTTTLSRSSSIITLIGPATAPSMMDGVTLSPSHASYASSLIMSSPPSTAGSVSPVLPHEAMQVTTPGEPGRIPPLFGFSTYMDSMDRRLWDFYIKNWCPGRSVLSNTNLWLTDFASMHKNEGILCAIQSLAGVYIYDYLPDERIRKRINDRYIKADEIFRSLLTKPESYEIGKGSEVITMAVILSMQDIVLTERRLKKPHMPRWLAGFKQGEHFLQMTDPGGRFWQDDNIQLDNLRISQSIIVGRAMILAQPMMELPSPETLDPVQEASRFGWLLYGTEEAMYEIHGGCGFSKKLLHTMSQITYCAARLQQEPTSTMVPMTARYLHRELLELRQWSSESEPWELARKRPPVIEWIRAKPDNFVIDTHNEMTDATAEAWRFAAIIYLQCRVMRLPRNHPEVLSNLGDLAKCIRIMPTSGSHFTAQAPLLPVFFLGLLATLKDHAYVSEAWFEQVSVPPLYQALKRIRAWIDAEVEIPSMPTALPKIVSMRYPWWEHFVTKVREKEEETLCLT
ncbi:hypothetical protein AK830_g5628 [Neonectria ditissima]|uniref:Transcription factor domain-containing protein n=1 Tax=Neonectria ditissima TaxID=78410 RepID=A0A0P7BKT6_9HYPO|nr:hypothetical protein AK830_g5628 [Neonectria ditissima]